SARPDAHTQRYDRQLRLWASSGQRSLESSNILCVGSSSLACAILKNLILPGIGTFTIVDDARVTQADLGVSFFLEEECIGRSRAAEHTRFLLELNPQVKGHAVQLPPSQLLSSSSSLVTSATLVLLINQPGFVSDAIADAVWQRGVAAVPVLAVRESGFVGEVRAQIREAGVIETHPTSTDDLRLALPWPELAAFATNYAIDPSDSHSYAHIPYIVLLLRAIESWKEKVSNGPPPKSSDRKAFAAHIDASRVAEAEGENFDEAHAALGTHVWRAFTAPPVPDDVRKLFEDPACHSVGPQSSNFWLLLHALRSFVQAEASSPIPGGAGLLPLPGSLPDLKALSTTYVELSNLYRRKAKADLELLKLHLAQTLRTAGVPSDAISSEEVERFAKLAGHVRLVRGRKLSEQRSAPNKESVLMALQDPVNPVVVPHALAFLASDRFYASHGRLPGASRAYTSLVHGDAPSNYFPQIHNESSSNGLGSSQERANKRQKSDEPEDEDEELVANDVAVLKGIAKELAQSLGVDDDELLEKVEQAAHEIVRSAHSGLPSTSALLGGVAAQEAIKLITRQYLPIDNTSIYDGIQQAIGTFNL
ncbi:hypothetical protein IE81DRAFT_288928, partial [Ceraceosorus guamensis]